MTHETLTRYEAAKKAIHPLYGLLRKLRVQAGESRSQFAARTGFNDAVVGSYERGGRSCTVEKYDAIIGHYGQRLATVPAAITDERLAAALALLAAAEAVDLDKATAAA